MKVIYPNYLGFRHLAPGDLAYFTRRVLAAGLRPIQLAEVIEFESAKSWSPRAGNPVKGPVGLIQFTRTGGAKMLGLTIPQLAAMSFRRQLEEVIRYFQAFNRERLHAENNLNNYHLAAWGDGVGAVPSYVLAVKDGAHASSYAGNSLFDQYPADGTILAGELDRVTSRNALAGVNGTVSVDLSAPITLGEAEADTAAVGDWLVPALAPEYWRAMRRAH